LSKKLSVRRRKKKVIKSRKKIFGLFLILLLVIAAGFIGAFLYYQSRAIAELPEENQMTMLPADVSTVLGAKTGPKIANQTSIRIPIFMYHRVEYVQDKNDTERIKLTTPPYVLQEQIETLKAAGYTFVTPSDLALALNGKAKNWPKKPIILSFDDGYMDFYTDVFPILKQEKVKAVAYIIVDFLNRPDFMFSFQLEEIARSPLIEIGAHTMDHLALQGMATDSAKYQIFQSRIALQKELHLPINSFAYPYGSFDQQAINLVRAAGFIDAASTIPDIKDTVDTKYYLYRLRPGYRTGQELLTFLSQDKFQPW
jgi:peptidoglycan/xylan/chitin deacetylase (PgdA/CDA1 family)